jgi:hypothetical protein
MSEGGIAWRRVSRGIFLVGVGTFLLLNTLGILVWSFWSEVLDYWPVLLVAAGVRLMFERSRIPWGILLSPLLVLGTMAWVALGGPGSGSGPRAWTALSAQAPPGAERWNLVASLAMARLEIAARPLAAGLLVEGRSGAAAGGGVRIEEDRDPARVRVENEWTLGGLPRARPVCELSLATEPPVGIDLRLAMTDATLDLASARLSRLDFGGAFNTVTLRLGPVESDVALDLKGAFNAMRIEVPASTPVRVDSRGFLNTVKGRRQPAARRGAGYTVTVRGAFNQLVVRSR